MNLLLTAICMFLAVWIIISFAVVCLCVLGGHLDDQTETDAEHHQGTQWPPHSA